MLDSGLVTDLVGRLIQAGLVQEANALLTALIGAIALGGAHRPAEPEPAESASLGLTSELQPLSDDVQQLSTSSFLASTQLIAVPTF